MKNILEFLIKKQVYGTLIIVLVTCIIYQIIVYIIDKITVHGKDELERKKRLTTIQLFKNISRYLLILFMVLSLLNLYGVNTTSFIAGLGIAGALVGLALQDTLKDVLNGISIIFDNYYVVGDIVTFNDFTGTIIGLGLKTTKIKKITGEILTISNRNIDKIINLSQEKDTVILDIPTAYEEKFDKVEDILTKTINSIKENNSDVKEVEFLGLNEFAESSTIYQVKFTCSRGTQWTIRRLFLKEIKLAYEKNNIKIPYNQLEVHNGKKL